MFRQFLHHVVPGVVKPMRVLWNEIIGFVFLVFSILMGFSTYRNFRNIEKSDGSALPLIAGSLFAGLMLYFGITSFMRARKISRS